MVNQMSALESLVSYLHQTTTASEALSNDAYMSISNAVSVCLMSTLSECLIVKPKQAGAKTL